MGAINLKAINLKAYNVYFHVQRRSTFSEVDRIIPFEVELANTGGAMNEGNGTFRAPLKGDYFFIFSGMKNNDHSSIAVRFKNKNGKGVASSFAPGRLYQH